MRRRCVAEEGRGILNGELVSMREAAVGGGNVDRDDECGADEYETGVWEGGGGASEKTVFKREVQEGWERMYVNTGNDKNGFGGK